MPVREKGAERRSLYRAPSQSSGNFEVEVKTSSGHCYTGEAVGASVEGIGVRFPKRPGTVLTIGEPVTLSFRLPHLSHRIELGATPTNSLAQASCWRYGFQFNDKLDAPAEFAARFYRVFNRRRAYRVEPNSASAVEVTVVAGETAQTAKLDNISATGIALSIDGDSVEPLARSERWVLSFCLPDTEERLTMVATVRHSDRTRQQRSYGLEFNPNETEHFEIQQQVIMDFVMRRLLEKTLTDAA